MSGALEQIQTRTERTQRFFWVSTYPFFDTVLAVTPPADAQEQWPLELHFNDPDGAEINSVSLNCSPFEPTLIDLDQFMGGCKLEGGFKHALMQVSVPQGSFVTCRLQGRDSASFAGPLVHFMNDKATFLPVTFSAERSYLLAMANFAETESAVRCRLMCGKRAPETVIALPGRGVRLVSLSSTFPQFALHDGGTALQGYVRLTTRSEAGVGVQLIERTELVGSEGFAYGGLGV